MAFYQNTVLNKHLKGLNSEKIHAAYAQFKAHFHNPDVQQNIRASKEEQYQEGFLRDLFVNILGYTLNPNADFNLTTEYKNVKDSKKADGAILINEKVCTVIELKGTETTDLDKVEPQAFGYKNNQPECTYIVISNFEKLRFYIDNAIEYIEFNLFTLTHKEFELLWICLAYESIATDLPKKIKNASISEEDSITKKLYKDYSLFKRELHQNLVVLNPEMDELLLFKKSQKLLDRFLFLLFAEDRQLLPPNSVREILKQWNELKDLDAYTPLYSRFKLYFGYLNTGHKGKHHDIFAYNGGLFKPDDVLDVVQIDDDLLYQHTLKLSDYDFASEVDVNILGHIFENSLNELDELTALATGQEFDKSKTKRKRDGVVYTPKYITKYIVDNTVGKLCEEKQTELGLKDEDFSADKKQNKTTKKLMFDKLTAYREWLLQITICDPACGSGAFLVEALDFLIREHRYIDELQAKLFGDTLVLSDVEKSILENNLFGVDINEESVEIAKLSLWLRTAQPNRKLNDLNNNIKCGNSLIDDPTVAGEKAFNWQKEFPQVFGANAENEPTIIVDIPQTPDYLQLIKEKSLEAQQKAEQGIALSKEALEITKQLTEYADKLQAVSEPEPSYQTTNKGFDVVIGNPPYVRLETMKELSEQMSKLNYRTFEKRGDLYCLFVERGFNILKPNGTISFIMPNKWMQAGYGKPLREFFLQYELNQLIDFGDIQIFEGATTYPCIFVSRKARPKDIFSVSVLNEVNIGDFYLNVNNTAEVFQSNQFTSDTWVISSGNEKKLFERLQQKFKTLYEFIGGEAFYGMKTGLTEAFLINETTKQYLLRDDPNAIEIIKPVLRGRDINKWTTGESNGYIIGTFPALNIDIEKYPSIKKHLLGFGKERLEQTGDKGSRKKTNNKWFETQDTFAYWETFTKPKIMYQKFQVKPCFIYDEKGLYCNDSMWIIPSDDKGLLAILNSKMGWWLITKYCTQIQNGVQLIWKYFGQIPIANTTEELAVNADKMITLHKQLNAVSQKFQRMLQRKFDMEDLPGKLQNWYALTYKDFVTELGKKKIKFTLAQEAEWEDYFSAEQAKALEIKAQIDSTDREIDRMVYALYGLAEEEIKIVEG